MKEGDQTRRTIELENLESLERPNAKTHANAVHWKRKKRPKATVLKINNFLYFAGAGSVLPYLSVYFLHYTDASEKEFGRIMSSSAVFGTILNLIISSLGDKYRAHRLIYILTLLCTYMAVAFLFVPILTSRHHGELTERATNQTETSQITTTIETLTITAIDLEEFVTNHNPVQSIDQNSTPGVEPTIGSDQTDRAGSFWVHLIGVCLAISSLGIAINAGFSESFSANMTCGANHETGGESYSALRFYGALGWCLASLVLSQINERALGLPYLFVAWLLYLCFHGLTLLLVTFWPDKRPFSLAPELEQVDGLKPGDDVELGISFGGRRKLFPPRVFIQRETPESICTKIRRFSADLTIDKANRPEVRRNSIAALGSSHVVECFELASCNGASAGVGEKNLKRWFNRDDISGASKEDGKHFDFITKIRPMEQVPKVDLAMALNHERNLKDEEQKISFRLIVKIIELIARRNPNVPRFMVLYSVVGFLVAMNWYFLFPYLEQLDPAKFRKLAPYVMMSTYLSEMLFYFASARLPFKPVRPSIALSLVLLVFSLRYASYLTFAWWPWWPLEMIVAIELLQALTIAWFDCILNESAMEFALEAEHCLPKLIELKLINDELRPRSETIELVRSSIKLTLVGVSACFYDGIGVAVGSLVGGLIIVRYDYAVLWMLSTAISLLVSLANLFLECALFSGRESASDKQATKKRKWSSPMT